MRTIVSAVIAVSLFVLVINISRGFPEKQEPVLYKYVVENFEDDCGTSNAVTAILLNYRMYDTMFEVLILLTAIIGMKHFLPSPYELKRKDKERRGSLDK